MAIKVVKNKAKSRKALDSLLADGGRIVLATEVNATGKEERANGDPALELITE